MQTLQAAVLRAKNEGTRERRRGHGAVGFGEQDKRVGIPRV
jgi:hypothetical protein